MSTYEQQDYSGSNFGRCPSWCHQRLIRMPVYPQRNKALRVRQQYKIHWSQNVKFPALVYLLITRILYNRQVLKKQAVGRRPPRYAPAQACKWWHDVRHVRIWIGSSLLYVHVGLPVRVQPTKVAWWPWPFDLESGVRVACDVGYLCASFSLLRPLCSRVMPVVRTRQTDVRQKHRLMPPPIRGWAS